MRIDFFTYTSLLILLFFLKPTLTLGHNASNTHISGKISIDRTWDSMIYLSHIPSYDLMYEMSNEMIIARKKVDSLGSFEFDINFLPCNENLFRLHITKKGDTPATLIIGGKDENHLFLILNCNSNIHITSIASHPPFRHVIFKNSDVNSDFHQISSLVSRSDSLAAESSASKRALIEEKLNENLLLIADTSNNFLVSLYAIYKSKFESKYSSNSAFYNSYLKKWSNQNNDYFNSFKNQMPIRTSNYPIIFLVLIITALLSIIGYYVWKYTLRNNKGIQELSIQERKVFDLLRKGATNQEISDQYNIGLSTVKSHVSSIYSKLNIKSRKDILNLKV